MCEVGTLGRGRGMRLTSEGEMFWKCSGWKGFGVGLEGVELDVEYW